MSALSKNQISIGLVENCTYLSSLCCFLELRALVSVDSFSVLL